MGRRFAVAITLLLSACGGSTATTESPSPSRSSTPSPSTAPALAPGTYVLTQPITREEAVAAGLKGANIRENLGGFTFEVDATSFTLTQDPPKPVEFPVVTGFAESKGDLIVLTPTTFAHQIWTLRPHLEGTTLTFEVVHVESPFGRESLYGVRTIFETHPWRAQS